MFLRIMTDDGIELAQMHMGPGLSPATAVAHMLLSGRMLDICKLAQRVVAVKNQEEADRTRQTAAILVRMLEKITGETFQEIDATTVRAELVIGENAPHLLSR